MFGGPDWVTSWGSPRAAFVATEEKRCFAVWRWCALSRSQERHSSVLSVQIIGKTKSTFEGHRPVGIPIEELFCMGMADVPQTLSTHGLMTWTSLWRKSSTLRVAMVKPWHRAVAAKRLSTMGSIRPVLST